MRNISCLVLLVVIALASSKGPHYDIKDTPALFEKFIKDYNRHYKDAEDKQVHLWNENLKSINKFNENLNYVVFHVAQFFDYMVEESKGIKMCDYYKLFYYCYHYINSIYCTLTWMARLWFSWCRAVINR